MWASNSRVPHASCSRLPRARLQCVFVASPLPFLGVGWQAFQHDEKCRVFVGSIRTAGQGITLTAASRVLFVELDYSPMVLAQAEDRCHRIGQTESLLVEYLMVRGSLDERLGTIVAQKMGKLQPLYQSASVAQLPARERQPQELRVHIDEVMAREREAKAAYEAAKAHRQAQRDLIKASEEGEREKQSALEAEAERARSSAKERAARAREKYAKIIREDQAEQRADFEAKLEAEAAKKWVLFEEMAMKKELTVEERYEEVEAEFEASRQQQKAIMRAAEDAVEETRKELERCERQARRETERHAKALEGGSSKQGGGGKATVAPADSNIVPDDGSHDEDFGEVPPEENDAADEDDEDDDGSPTRSA